MDDRPDPALLTELRYALDVFEECSHLGLDEQGASRIRRILLRQIAKTERALACQSAPAAPFECEVFVEYSTDTDDRPFALHRLNSKATHN
jgi:hypothetical protein